MNLFDKILAHPDIVVRPSHAGGEYEAWCPWHPDREGGKPSLGINAKKRIVKCFVCEKGGTKALAQAWDLMNDKPPWKREIEQVFDYLTADGNLLFQVVRFKTKPGMDKDIVQRRPDPDKHNQFLWNLKGIRLVLYRLPELRAADPGEWVFIVEGEKDADRVAMLGFVATTNPQGAGKWRKYYNPELRGRRVVIIPDNDDPGKSHAQAVAASLHGVADLVKILDLDPAVPHKGDIENWLDDGHTAEELREMADATPLYEPSTEAGEASEALPAVEWEPSRLLPRAISIIESMKARGFFVYTGSESFYFDNGKKVLIPLDKDEMALRTYLNVHYNVNRQEHLYMFAFEQMMVDAVQHGRSAKIGKFSYYDDESRKLFLDMGKGKVLRLDGENVNERDNGADGVLFAPNPRFEP